MQSQFTVSIFSQNCSSLTGQTLTRGEIESGQFPIIIISFLTHQEFLGVLIGLVMNGGTQLPFLAYCVD